MKSISLHHLLSECALLPVNYYAEDICEPSRPGALPSCQEWNLLLVKSSFSFGISISALLKQWFDLKVVHFWEWLNLIELNITLNGKWDVNVFKYSPINHLRIYIYFNPQNLNATVFTFSTVFIMKHLQPPLLYLNLGSCSVTTPTSSSEGLKSMERTVDRHEIAVCRKKTECKRKEASDRLAGQGRKVFATILFGLPSY